MLSAIRTPLPLTDFQLHQGIPEKILRLRIFPRIENKAELLYYRWWFLSVSFRSMPATGLLMLIGLLIMVLKGGRTFRCLVRILTGSSSQDLYSTLSTCLRCTFQDIRYEQRVRIDDIHFVGSILAGFISAGNRLCLSATAVLAGLTLMVAPLSFNGSWDYQPCAVLKSYWTYASCLV